MCIKALLRKTKHRPLPHLCTIFGWVSWVGACLLHTEVWNTQGGEACLKEVETEKKNELSCLFIWYPEESKRRTMVTTDFLSLLSVCYLGMSPLFYDSSAHKTLYCITPHHHHHETGKKANSFLMILSLSLSQCSKWLYVQIILEKIILKACHCTLQMAARTPWCISPLLKQLPKINK